MGDYNQTATWKHIQPDMQYIAPAITSSKSHQTSAYAWFKQDN